MPTFNFYSAWMDPVFYLWALAAAAALVGLIYSIRRYLELKNAAFDDEPEPEQDPAVQPAAEVPAETVQPELSAEVPAEPPAEASEQLPEENSAAEGPAGPAETFVRGIYEGISGLDARLKGIEASLSKSRVNDDFTVKFLEDILQDIDNLDKQKLRARIEYLLSDLKK